MQKSKVTSHEKPPESLRVHSQPIFRGTGGRKTCPINKQENKQISKQINKQLYWMLESMKAWGRKKSKKKEKKKYIIFLLLLKACCGEITKGFIFLEGKKSTGRKGYCLRDIDLLIFLKGLWDHTRKKEMSTILDLFNLVYLSEVKVKVEEVESRGGKGHFQIKVTCHSYPQFIG